MADTDSEILDSAAVLRVAFDRTRDAVIVLDEGGTVRLGNPAACALLASTPESLPGHRLPELLPPGWREGPRSLTASIADDRGLELALEVETAPVERGGVVLAVAVVHDVSEKREAERDRAQVFTMLERAKRDWERTFDSIGECILLIAGAGTVFRVNRALADRLGKPFPEVLGRSVEELLGPAVAGAVDRALAGGEPEPSPVRADTVDALFTLSAYPLPGAPAEGDRAVVVLKEVTEKERLRQQLIHAERLSSLGEIISGIAHELNNPLTGVLGFAQMLSQKDVEGRFEREIAHLREESQRATRIVKNLLSFARRQEPRREPEDLNEVVRRSVALREYALAVRNIDVELALAEDLPRTRMDGGQIQQVVLNLLNNAEHAIRSGEGSGRVRIATERAGDLLRLVVTDDGPGVPGEIRGEIFTPFVTTKPAGQGTGLGLSVCAGILEDHGGEIRLDAAFTGGARFVVELPLREEQADAVPVPAGREEPPARGPLRVLLVDDEPAVREIGAEFLGQAGHAVTAVSGAAKALEAMRAGDFDVVVTDHHMPGMTGAELHRRACAEMPRYRDRFVLVSGDTTRARPLEPRVRVLDKPLDFAELVRVAEEVGNVGPDTR